MILGKQAKPEILRDIGVLIFVHQDRFEPLLIVLQNRGFFAEECQAMQQKITEIAGVQGQEPLLIGLIELAFARARSRRCRRPAPCRASARDP